MSTLYTELELNRSITTNFKYSEMCYSSKATQLGIPNLPTGDEAKHIEELVTKILQPLRNEIKLPIKVNSGFRNPRVNKLVGGVSNSAHLTGYAADIVCPSYGGGSVKKFCEYVRDFLIKNNIKFDQLIFEYGTWVHIGIRDLGGRQRGEVITINKKGKFQGIVS